MNIIFLDVDGVLNNRKTVEEHIHGGNSFLDDDNLEVLKKLVKETDSCLVLSSSWRAGLTDSFGTSPKNVNPKSAELYYILCGKLNQFDMNLLSETPIAHGLSKEEAIIYWLYDNVELSINGYVILDDEEYEFPKLKKHLYLTSVETGLTMDCIENVKKIFDLEI